MQVFTLFVCFVLFFPVAKTFELMRDNSKTKSKTRMFLDSGHYKMPSVYLSGCQAMTEFGNAKKSFEEPTLKNLCEASENSKPIASSRMSKLQNY